MPFLVKLNLQTGDNDSKNHLQVRIHCHNWKSCAIGERMKREDRDLDKVKDLTPETV